MQSRRNRYAITAQSRCNHGAIIARGRSRSCENRPPKTRTGQTSAGTQSAPAGTCHVDAPCCCDLTRGGGVTRGGEMTRGGGMTRGGRCHVADCDTWRIVTRGGLCEGESGDANLLCLRRRRSLSPNKWPKKRSSSSKMKPIAIPSITVSCAPSRVANEIADPAIASAGIAIARAIHNTCITTAMHVVYRPQPSRRSFHSTTCKTHHIRM